MHVTTTKIPRCSIYLEVLECLSTPNKIAFPWRKVFSPLCPSPLYLYKSEYPISYEMLCQMLFILVEHFRRRLKYERLKKTDDVRSTTAVWYKSSFGLWLCGLKGGDKLWMWKYDWKSKLSRTIKISI